MKNKCIPLALATALAASGAAAVDLGHGLSLKGFGTAGVTHSSEDGADFLADYYFQPNGAGRSGETVIDTDTKFGLQLDWAATDWLSLTTQVISKKYENSSWTPRIEWAFAKLSPTRSLDVRFGRIRPAIYMLSDFLDVNYANPWVRPPVEFYSSAPISRMKGIDLLWRPSFGGVSMLVQPYVGTAELDAPRATTFEPEKIRGLNLSASRGDFSVRFGYMQTDLTAVNQDLTQAQVGLGFLCSGGDPVACYGASTLIPNESKTTFTSIGGTWDNGDYFVTGEFGKRGADSFIADATSWYLSGGARIGDWTPYVTYAGFRNDSPTVETAGTGDLGGGITTNAIITQLLTQNQMDQDSFTLGARYDVAPNFALKAQWDHIQTDCRNGQPGTCHGVLGNVTPAFDSEDQSVNVFSVSIDFVF